MKKYLTKIFAILCAVTFIFLCASAAFADEKIIYSGSLTPFAGFMSQAAQNQATAEEIKKAEMEAMAAYFNKWKISLTPYMFFFSMDAGIEVGDRVSNSVLSPDQVKSMLDSQTNVRLDINKAHWGCFIDTSNMNFGKSQSVNRLQSDFSMNAIINHYCAYYRCTGIPVLDIYGGARYYSFTTDLTLKFGGLPSRSIPSVNSWTDPIIGARLTKPFTKNFAVTIGGDGGGFSATQKSMSLYGLLSWTITPNISLNGGYEYLKFKRSKQAPIVDTFNMSATMSGPIVQVGINF